MRGARERSGAESSRGEEREQERQAGEPAAWAEIEGVGVDLHRAVPIRPASIVAAPAAADRRMAEWTNGGARSALVQRCVRTASPPASEWRAGPASLADVRAAGAGKGGPGG